MTLRKIKGADIIAQILAPVLTLLAYSSYYPRGAEALSALISLGAWQVLSFLLHFLAYKRFKVSAARRVYTVCIIVVTIGALAALKVDSLALPFFYLLLFAGPVMALLYFFTCVGEWIGLRKRD